MPENYFVKVRRLQKLELFEHIKKNKDMDKKQLLATFSLQTGLRIATIEQYYEELRDAKLIT